MRAQLAVNELVAIAVVGQRVQLLECEADPGGRHGHDVRPKMVNGSERRMRYPASPTLTLLPRMYACVTIIVQPSPHTR